MRRLTGLAALSLVTVLYPTIASAQRAGVMRTRVEKVERTRTERVRPVERIHPGDRVSADADLRQKMIDQRVCGTDQATCRMRAAHRDPRFDVYARARDYEAVNRPHIDANHHSSTTHQARPRMEKPDKFSVRARPGEGDDPTASVSRVAAPARNAAHAPSRPAKINKPGSERARYFEGGEMSSSGNIANPGKVSAAKGMRVSARQRMFEAFMARAMCSGKMAAYCGAR
jgi:hypothetical protein